MKDVYFQYTGYLSRVGDTTDLGFELNAKVEMEFLDVWLVTKTSDLFRRFACEN